MIVKLLTIFIAKPLDAGGPYALKSKKEREVWERAFADAFVKDTLMVCYNNLIYIV